MFGTPVAKQWGLEPSNNIRGYMPYGHLQGDGFLFLFLPVFPSLTAKVKKTSSPAPVRFLTTENSSVCTALQDTVYGRRRVLLVRSWGGQFVGRESVNVNGSGPLKLTIISLSTSWVRWEDKAQWGRWGKWCCLVTVRGELPKTG